jgi:hypothetical protein
MDAFTGLVSTRWRHLLTEGFDTAEPKDAKALLEELSNSPR